MWKSSTQGIAHNSQIILRINEANYPRDGAGERMKQVEALKGSIHLITQLL